VLTADLSDTLVPNLFLYLYCTDAGKISDVATEVERLRFVFSRSAASRLNPSPPGQAVYTSKPTLRPLAKMVQTYKIFGQEIGSHYVSQLN
jgi:hypothetical protein